MARLARLERHLSAGDTGLILFDALNGYLHPNNPAKVQFLAERNIIPNLQRLLQGARNAGMTVFYPSGAHAPDGSDSVDRLTDTDMDLAQGGDAGRPIRPHFHAGSRDAEIAVELTPARGHVMVPNQRPTPFFQTNLHL